MSCHDSHWEMQLLPNRIHFIFLMTRPFIRAIELIHFEDNNRFTLVSQNEPKLNLPIWKYIITPA